MRINADQVAYKMPRFALSSGEAGVQISVADRFIVRGANARLKRC